ncbi:nectin-1-like [Haliotis cracherodii]|uniref:nectin-1-like n=1 Tax=Haliotis cracherodii TaxID=6455 RepID=UPI0039EB2E0B
MSSLIGNIATCAFLMTVYTSMVAGDFEVPEAAEGYIGQSTTLQCKLEGYHRWYVISWIRRRPDGSEVTIVRLPADSKTPEWATGVDYSFKSRIRQKITIETELTEFTLVLRNLQCSDRGMYVCKYVGTSTVQKVLHLSVKVDAMRPSIHYNYLVIEVNSSLIVDCKAKVGYPPKKLTWFYRSKGHDRFEVIPNNRPMREIKNNECDIYATQPLEIFANTNATHVIYRCAFEGDYNRNNMYDEVSVRLPAVEVKPATERHDCMKTGSCAMEAVDGEHNRGSSSTLTASLTVMVVLCAAAMVGL